MITLEQRKFKFIEKYIGLNNLKTIQKLERVLNEDVDKDDIYLSDEMKEAIDQGINSLDEGKGMTHQEVILQLKQKYPTLKF